ncbi:MULTISPECIES: galactose ABC transporter substrate-binding protein [unclassified Clostridium]|uniref:galactose ABC transporter substrate-binding protein n=1 Tax=unclassified Clostridium TaxID=2614128 RepID=UPI000297321B|nr:MULTISPECIES: galactose ABC transporter substrate-binding protein [unclassified Clostridium]EKQ58056.1 MAG: ABC-type sugar transport system, periplasmic component [Clostridium sp. Maddingley MBC34-26]
MKTLRRIIVILEIVIIMFSTILMDNNIKVNAKTNQFRERPVSVDVVLYNFEDKFISLVRQSLEEIQKQNPGKVEFKFFDGKGNQAIQSEVIDNIIRNERVDFLLVNLVNTQATKEVIDMVKSKDIPVVFFNREPVAIDPIKAYKKSYYVGTNAKEAGSLQGEILINLWNNDRSFIDKNNDGILQYIMLQGERSSIEAQERTQYSILSLNKAGIKTEQLALNVSNWRRDMARDAINSLFLQYSTRIEAIIANNDEMAIGAIEALQSHGYNMGDKTKTIPVVGVDATEEAQELIKKGYMAGSVIQNPAEMAQAIYAIGLNLFQGNDPLYNTQYKSDETGVAIRLPYKRYIA